MTLFESLKASASNAARGVHRTTSAIVTGVTTAVQETSSAAKANAQQIAASATAAAQQVTAATKAAAHQIVTTVKSAYQATKTAAAQTYDTAKAKLAEVYDQAKAAGSAAAGKVQDAAGAVKGAFSKKPYDGALLPCPTGADTCGQLAKEAKELGAAIMDAKLADDVYNANDDKSDNDDASKIAPWKRMSEHELKNELGLSDREIAIMRGDDGSSFRATAYKSEDTPPKYTLSFRGTQTAEDWRENATQGAGAQSASYKKAAQLARALSNGSRSCVPANLRGYEGRVSLTGHSLGGGLASAASAEAGFPARTFNAAGLHKNTIGGARTTRDPSQLNDRVSAYYNEADPLNRIQDNPTLWAPAYGTVIAAEKSGGYVAGKLEQSPIGGIPLVKEAAGLGGGIGGAAAGMLAASKLLLVKAAASPFRTIGPPAAGTRKKIPYVDNEKQQRVGDTLDVTFDGAMDAHGMPRMMKGLEAQAEALEMKRREHGCL